MQQSSKAATATQNQLIRPSVVRDAVSPCKLGTRSTHLRRSAVGVASGPDHGLKHLQILKMMSQSQSTTHTAGRPTTSSPYGADLRLKTSLSLVWWFLDSGLLCWWVPRFYAFAPPSSREDVLTRTEVEAEEPQRNADHQRAKEPLVACQPLEQCKKRRQSTTAQSQSASHGRTPRWDGRQPQ
jgi:hypothetical protein